MKMKQGDTISTMPPQDPSPQLDNRVLVITKMHAKDVATGLRRIPVWFYASIQIGIEEYRTTRKHVSLDSGAIEWTDHISLPPDPSMMINLRIYASFELGPMLGRGGLLRKLTISVQDLIDRSNGGRPIVFLPKEGGIMAGCSSLEVNVCTVSASELSSVVLSPRVTAGSDGERDTNLLTDAGHSHILRYYRSPQGFHLDNAITQYERVVARCADHSRRGAALSNLAMAKLMSCLARGAYLDLDVPISLYRQAIDLRPHDHPDRAFTLINLANTLLSRFIRRGCDADAQEAEELLAAVLDMCPSNSYEYRSALLVVQTFFIHNGADCMVRSNGAARESSNGTVNRRPPYSLDQLCDMLEECELRDDAQLLDSVLSHCRHAEVHCVAGQPDWIVLQSILAHALIMRFGRACRQEDLDEAIQRNQTLMWISAEHPHRSSLLNNLGNALATRFEQRGDGHDLDEAVQCCRDALVLRPIGHSHRSTSLNSLATALSTRFEVRGDGNDLDEAIQHHRGALSLRSVGHAYRPASLSNLGCVLMTRFEERGDDKDLDEAIQHHRAALILTPTGHPHRSTIFNSLANALRTRFEQRGDDNDLDEEIQLYHGALALTPVGHPNHSGFLTNLAIALTTRFEQRGDGNDIDKAIQHYRDALMLRPIGHSQRFASLQNLATALRTRFNQRGSASDLEEALRHYRDALLLTPIGHTRRSTSLNNLGNALVTQFEQRGNDNNLDEAIQHYCDALSLTPTGHPERPTCLSNLAHALEVQFHQRGGNGLDEAIQQYREALALRPIGHSQRFASLQNLATALRTRFDQRGSANDLDEALQHYRDALSLTPVGHAHRSTSLNNLATALMTRFLQQRDASDLDEAIQHYRDSCALRPIGYSACLNNLAAALMRRFECQTNNADADEALRLCRTAEAETPSSHPARLSSCYRFIDIHLTLWKTSHIATHFDSAMDHYRAAADVEPAGLLARLQSCLAWVNHAEQHQHVSCLDAYTKSLQLLDAHVSATVSVSDRHATMKQFPTSLAVDAASCALRQGDVPHALELLEQGRTLLWNQLTRCRTSLDDLRSRGAHANMLVKRFLELSFQLGRQPTREPTGNLSGRTVDVEAWRYRQLVDEWNKVIAEIRMFDGFSRFLLPPSFADLQEAASEGPVIVLVASQFTCDAIIVLHDRPPIHIVLDITLERLVGLANQLLEHTFRSRDSQPRSAVGVLRQLWDAVMLPIVLKLEEFVQRGSRIWWCPTSIFTAFPLHAVGEYRKTSKRSVAVYTSSYTPSLSALIKARKTKFASSPVHFAAIGQALPDGHQVPLQCVDREVDEIGRLLSSSSTIFTKLPSVESTKQQALHALQNNPWVHFSCHGTQNFDEPFKSHLAMRDGPLSLLDIINSDLSKHEFAFLSACKTAVGDLRTLDEALHLAAGLQFMGVKSVIGTLWSVADDVAYSLVVKFYKHFCFDDKMDPSRAARVLHQAVLSLARDKVPLEDWMLFIHIGI